MSMTTKIKSMLRDTRYKTQATRGRAQQAAGKATGNARLRRRGKAGELKGRLNQLTKKIRDAIRP